MTISGYGPTPRLPWVDYGAPTGLLLNFESTRGSLRMLHIALRVLLGASSLLCAFTSPRSTRLSYFIWFARICATLIRMWYVVGDNFFKFSDSRFARL